MLLEMLKELEVLLHDPQVRSSAERTGQLLHSSFREFGRSGATYTRQEILAHLSGAGQQPVIWAQDFQLEVLSEGVALLTYRSGHIAGDGELQHHTNRSSLWQLTEDGWKMRFHQGTATQPFEKRATQPLHRKEKTNMLTDMNRDLGRRFFEAQDRLRGGPDADLCASNYVARIGSNPSMTLSDHQGFASAFYAGFPDLHHTVEEIIADDATAVVRFTLRGTHLSSFMGIPPSEKPVEVGAIAILHIADGRVTELRAQFDQFGMMRQLGVIG